MHHKKLRPYLVVIFGPTGVGKTEAALELAQQIPSEIVNIDVGQFYSPLSIGTAKPDWRSQDVPHHLFDIVHQPSDYSAAAYRTSLLKTVNAIWQKNSIPLVVGGSCFYVRALFFPPQLGGRITEMLNENYSEDQLWHKLNEIDPCRAQLIHPHDTYRLKRALAIWHATGKKPSEFAPRFDPPSDFTLICLTRDINELYERINQRTKIMIKEGWIEEVKPLIGSPWESFLRKKNIIGYPDLFDYLEGKQDLDATIANIQTKTRNYAKRQLIFWRGFQKQLQAQHISPTSHIETVNLTSTNLERYIKLLSKQIHFFAQKREP